MKRLLIAVCGIGFLSLSLANSDYNAGSEFASGIKNKGTDTIKNTNPADIIPNYIANPSESGYYGGVTSGGSGGLEQAGSKALHSNEAGQLTMEVIKNKPEDKLDLDAPFIKGGLDMRDKAEDITGGDTGLCQEVALDKTEFTSHQCERTPAVELACTRTARIELNAKIVKKTRKVTKTVWLELNRQARPAAYRHDFASPDAGKLISVSLDSDQVLIPHNYNYCDERDSAQTCRSSIDEKMQFFGKTFPVTIVKLPYASSHCSGGENEHCSYYTHDGVGKINTSFAVNQEVTLGQKFLLTKTSKYYGNNYRGGFNVNVTFTYEYDDVEANPEIIWTEVCPFDKSEEVKIATQCTEKGGPKTVTYGGKSFTLYSDCWAYKDTYVSQSADNGSCQQYMSNKACTLVGTVCQESVSGSCLREQATFSCQKGLSGTAQLCGTELICASGECDQIKNDKANSFQKAVSALAAVAAAGEDVAELNDINVKAFTGKRTTCRKAAMGFNNCCKSGGWGSDVGLAHCDSEEKALGKAKSRNLTIYVGSYCSNKVLGVCLQKKEAYCVFDSKLAKIVQEQGRGGQLRIGFGSAKNSDCRGITVDELQAINFDRLNFADFYSDLESGTDIPADQELIDRVKNQIANGLQGQGGHG